MPKRDPQSNPEEAFVKDIDVSQERTILEDDEDTLDRDYVKRLQAEELAEADQWLEQRTGQSIHEEEQRQPVIKTPTATEKKQPETFKGKIVKNVAEIPIGAAKGPIAAGAEFVETMDDFQSWVRSLSGGEAEDLELIDMEALTSKLETETTGGGLAKGVTQFLTGFLPIFKGSKLIKLGGKGVMKAKDTIPRALVSGALADMTVFDPKNKNLSALINELAPPLRNPITEFLESSPDDTDAEGRLKNAIEGLGLGAATEGIFIAARTMRTAKNNKMSKSKLKQIQKELEGVEDETIKNMELGELREQVIAEKGSIALSAPPVPIPGIKGAGAGKGVLPKELGPLIQEMRKYKDVEEFVQAPDIFFHGTPRAGATNIEKVGFIKTRGGRNVGKGISISKGFEVSKEFAEKDRALLKPLPKGKEGEVFALKLKSGTKIMHAEEWREMRNSIRNRLTRTDITAYARQKGVGGEIDLVLEGKLKFRMANEVMEKRLDELGIDVIDFRGSLQLNKSGEGELLVRNPDVIQKLGKIPERNLANFYNQAVKETESDLAPSAPPATPPETAVEAALTGKKGAEGASLVIDITEETKGKADEFFKTELPPEAITQRRFLGKNININFDRIETPDDVKMTLAKLTKIYQTEIEAWRGGTATHEETIQMAKASGLTLQQILDLKPGELLNRAETLAARHMEAFSAAELQKRAMAYRANPGPNAIEDFLKQLELHGRIAPKVAGVKTELGRSLEALKVGVDGNLILAEKVRGVVADINTGMPVESLMAKLTEMDSPEQLEKVARKALRPGYMDMFLEVWINGLLSNATTHMVNTISNMSVAAMAIPERAIAGQIHYGAKPGVIPGEASHLLYGMVMSTLDAFRLWGRTFREGIPSSELTKIEDQIRPKITAENFELSGWRGKAVDLLGEGIRLPGRFLMSADEFFKLINYRGELHAGAYRMAAQEGHEGDALARRIAEIVNDPPPSLREAATDFSHYQTFTKELGGTGRAIQNISNSHPAAKIILPFTRTPGNIFKFALERTPIANLMLRHVREAYKHGGAEWDLALAKMSLGGTVMATVAALAQAGYVTGNGPENPTLKQQWIDAGWQSNSIWINGAWYSFDRVDPVGALFGMAADFKDIALSGELSPDEIDKLAFSLATSFANNMVSKTYLMGLSKFMNAIVDPKRGAVDFAETFERSLVPSGLRQIARTTDPVQREMEEFIAELQSGIPGLSKDLPPQRDVLGNVQTSPWYNDISPFRRAVPKKDPVLDEINRAGVALRMPSRWVGSPGHGVKLDSQQYDRLVVLAGNEAKNPSTGLGFKDALEVLFQNPEYQELTDGPEGGKASVIERRMHGYRSLAEFELLQEYPDLAENVRKRQAGKLEAKYGAENLPEDLKALLEIK